MIQRLIIAVLIAGAIYGVGVGIGGALYASDRIATGPTHNDCEDFRKVIAERQGIDEHDVKQSDIKAEAERCLAGHEITEDEAFRTEFLLGSAWPALVVAAVYFLWPGWSRALIRQEEVEGSGGAH